MFKQHSSFSVSLSNIYAMNALWWMEYLCRNRNNLGNSLWICEYKHNGLMKRLLKAMDTIIFEMQLLKYTLLAFTSFKVICELYHYFVLWKLDNFVKVLCLLVLWVRELYTSKIKIFCDARTQYKLDILFQSPS